MIREFTEEALALAYKLDPSFVACHLVPEGAQYKLDPKRAKKKAIKG
jgi:hypothetical protein